MKKPEPVMSSELIARVQSAIVRYAKKLHPKRGLDRYGYERSDYAQIIWVQAVRSHKKFVALPGNRQVSPFGYLRTTVKNAYRDLRRRRCNGMVSVPLDDAALADESFAPCLLYRQQIVVLSKVCTKEELAWLRRLEASGGNVAGAYVPELGVSLRVFQSRILSLRRRLAKWWARQMIDDERAIENEAGTPQQTFSVDVTKASDEPVANSPPGGALPDCYGKYWEATKDEHCQVCLVQRQCFEVFSVEQVQPLLKGGNVDEASASLGVGVEAIGLAAEYTHQLAKKAESAEKPKERKKRALKRKVSETIPPPGAVSVQSVSDTAELAQVAEKKAAALAAARAARARQQFVRERQKNLWLAQLTQGFVLRRKWHNQEHEVHVQQDHYVYNGQRYPTLYQVVMAITGVREYKGQKKRTNPAERWSPRKMSAWSVNRFFRFHQVSLQAAQKELPNLLVPMSTSGPTD